MLHIFMNYIVNRVLKKKMGIRQQVLTMMAQGLRAQGSGLRAQGSGTE
jgi:hypothetical protein